MKVAIMQPYLFPYIGYYQLIQAVDSFVFYDDVQYIQRGWINRNRILVNASWRYFTLSVKKDLRELNINQREFASEMEQEKSRLLKQIKYIYHKAVYFSETFHLIQDIFSHPETNVAAFCIHANIKVLEYLNIKTKILISSQLDVDTSLKGQARIMEIVRFLCADTYINPIGGIDLYDKESFSRENIALYFLQSNSISYQQFSQTQHVPCLSIIDVMMFNSPEQIQDMLLQYQVL